jgi:hypothetical protein
MVQKGRILLILAYSRPDNLTDGAVDVLVNVLRSDCIEDQRA